MTKFYSAIQGCFYPLDMRSDYETTGTWPTDGVEVTQEIFDALMVARTQGKIIQADANGFPIAVDPVFPTVDQLKPSLIHKIDSDVDAVYSAVIGQRATEYALAESEANAYKSAGYTGTVPLSVSSWAIATGNTNQWAADSILATASNWLNIQGQIRATRLASKQAIKDADTQLILDTTMNSWSAFLTTIKTQLGL